MLATFKWDRNGGSKQHPHTKVTIKWLCPETYDIQDAGNVTKIMFPGLRFDWNGVFPSVKSIREGQEIGAIKMVQEIKALAAKPENPSSNP